MIDASCGSRALAPPKNLCFTSCSDILCLGTCDMVLFPSFRFKQLDLSFSDHPWHLGAHFGTHLGTHFDTDFGTRFGPKKEVMESACSAVSSNDTQSSCLGLYHEEIHQSLFLSTKKHNKTAPACCSPQA